MSPLYYHLKIKVIHINESKEDFMLQFATLFEKEFLSQDDISNISN